MEKQLLEMAQKQTEMEDILVPYGYPLPFLNEALPLMESGAQAIHHSAVNTETVIFPPVCNSLSFFFSAERKSKASRKQIQHHTFFWEGKQNLEWIW